MKVLVTGASGFIGSAVTAAFVRHGHHVLAGVRGTRPAPPGVTTVHLDLGEHDSVVAAVADVDVVCHLAALTRVRDSQTDPLVYWWTNTVGTLRLLDALAGSRRAGAPAPRLVLASTCAVYGSTGAPRITEDHPTAPGTPYGASKLAADQAAADQAGTGTLGAVSLRAFNVAGAHGRTGDADRTRLLPRALSAAAGTGPALEINGDGSAARDFLHVEDMAEAFVSAAAHCAIGRWRAYNLGSGRGTSISELVAAVERVTGRRVPRRHRAPAHEPVRLLADSTRARLELGWRPTRSTLDGIVGDAWRAYPGGPTPFTPRSASMRRS